MQLTDAKSEDDEWLPVVNEAGEVIGKATRGACHGGTKLLHPVVHLHVFNPAGELYLQKRSMHKDTQPGKWDTAVGGHVDCGETPDAALWREAREELGLADFRPEPVACYVFESAGEREWVSVYRTVYGGLLRPNPGELDGGRFWTLAEIVAHLDQNVFTPHFENDFRRFFVNTD